MLVADPLICCIQEALKKVKECWEQACTEYQKMAADSATKELTSLVVDDATSEVSRADIETM